MASTIPPLEVPPPPGEKATVSEDAPPASSANTDKTVTAPEHSAAQSPRFVPGLGKAIFSTELCTRAPRSLGSLGPPVIVRSIVPRNPEYYAAVVQAAHHWQRKYKSQCLCIFPGQGWSVEDLWDAEDIHVEGRTFCEEMLTFIERDTYYTAKKFADDWMHAHPDRLNFLGGDMGHVYNPSDPLDIVDSIFIFHEAEDFPRGFLWHVAHMMRTTVMEASRMNAIVSDANCAEHQGSDKARKTEETKASSTRVTVLSKTNRKKSRSRPRNLTTSTESSSVPETSARLPTMPPAAPHQPSLRPTTQQRVPSHGRPQSGGYQAQSKGHNMGTLAAQPMASPGIHTQAMNLPKGNRNMASGSYNQSPMQHGWIAENANRVPSGPHPRQHSGNMSNVESPQFVPAAMVLSGQPMMVPGFPGSPAIPYGQAPFMGPVVGHQGQYLDPNMAPHGHMDFQPGPMQAPPTGQNYMSHPLHGAPMGEMSNNMYYPSHMAPQHTDPRAPGGRRSGQHNGPVLFDHHNGTYRKFCDTTGHHGGGKKTGSNAFTNQSGGPGGRRVSASTGRSSYNNLAHNANHSINPASNRWQNNDRRSYSEDDPNITGDSYGGCDQNWIGSGNNTVCELWIGDLPVDVAQDEIRLLFKEKVGIDPIGVSINQGVGKGLNYHAFATFSSPEEAKAALMINERNPRIRGFRVPVTVPRRYYKKSVSPPRRESTNSGYLGQTHVDQTNGRATRAVTRMPSHDEESATVDAVAVPAASGKALYSPQDARSDLRKKVAQTSESEDPPRTGSPKAQKSKRQQASPMKNAKSKQPIEKPNLSKKDVKSTSGPSNNDATEVDPQDPAKVSVPNPTTATSVSSTPGKTVTATQTDETTSTVDTSTQALGIVPAAEHSDELTSADAKSPAVAPADPSPQPADDTTSDDETKNDSSFVSAKEEVEPQSEVRDGSSTANQDTSTTTLPSTAMSSHVEVNSSSSDPAKETKGDLAHVSPTQPEQQEVVMSDAQSISQGATEDAEGHRASQATVQLDVAQDKVTVPTQDTTTVSAPEDVAVGTSTQSSLVGAAKKTGAHQVESLFPFAKPSKQTKKGKGKQKQPRKKDEAEKAKAKAEKSTSSTKTIGGTAILTKPEQAADPVDSSTTADGSAQPTATTAPTNVQTAPASKTSKGKAKANIKEQDKTLSGGGEASGKQNSGTATKAPREIASVTQKTSVADAIKTSQGSSTASGTPFTGPVMTASDTSTSPSPLPQVPAPSKYAQASLDKKTSTPTVNHPNTSTHGYPTHNHIQGLQLDPNPGPDPLSSSTNLSRSDMSPFPRPSHLSSAISSTLQTDDVSHSSAAAALASMNATGTDVPQAEVPGKKKNTHKNRKKTSASVAAKSTPGDGKGHAVVPSISSPGDGEEVQHGYDAFQAQISHIDAIKTGTARKAYDDIFNPEFFKPISEPLVDKDGNNFLRGIDSLLDENAKTGSTPDEDIVKAFIEQLAAYRSEHPERQNIHKDKPTTEQDQKKSQD